MGAPQELLEAAKEAFENAYVPYSHFRVGAALRTARGTVVKGANVENTSFGLTRCAEQSAIQAMVTLGERDFEELVVYTESEPPSSPCGACRQVLAEFSPNALVHMVNRNGVTVTTTVSELLPGAFRLEPSA
ncbi:MAG: cytidine deaminase [Trueperaceae bacterium]